MKKGLQTMRQDSVATMGPKLIALFAAKQAAPNDPLARLRRVSVVMSIALSVAMVAATLVVAIVWLLPVVAGVTWLPGTGRLRVILATPAARIVAAAAVVILLAVLLYALDQARRMFAEFAVGEILTTRAAERAKRIAYATIAGALLRPTMRSAIALVVDPDELPRRPLQWVMSLRNSVDDLAFLFAGLLFLAIAWALAEAARIAADHRQFI